MRLENKVALVTGEHLESGEQRRSCSRGKAQRWLCPI